MPPPTLAKPAPEHAPRIGIFDSGIGGLSVLRAVQQHLPQAHCHYIADSRFTPWGDRPVDWVVARCIQLSACLLDGLGCDLVLVACNTATTQAIAALRQRWPGHPFVGIEPGIKPAANASRNARMALMATAGTLRSARLAHLMSAHAQRVTLLRLPCPGLVEAIEAADVQPQALIDQLDAISHSLRQADVDTVVLGCTHYPLVAAALAQRLGPGVLLVDTADAVARQVASLLPRAAAESTWAATAAAAAAAAAAATTTAAAAVHRPAEPQVAGLLPTAAWPPCLLSTGPPAVLQAAARRWLGLDLPVGLLRLPDPADPHDPQDDPQENPAHLSSPPTRG